MNAAKRVKRAFAYDSHGRLSPVGENIFQFRRGKKRRLKTSDKAKRSKESADESSNIGSLR